MLCRFRSASFVVMVKSSNNVQIALTLREAGGLTTPEIAAET